MTELTIEQALQKGIAAHKAGKVQDADRLYTAVLKAHPKQPDANHNMGVLAVGVGKLEQALLFFTTALEANSSKAQFWFSYIDALIRLERLADAKAVFDQAKEKGAKGDGFDKLEQRLNVTSGRSVESLTDSQEIEQARPNILDTLKLDQAIKLAKKRSKEGSQDEARSIYQDVLVKFPKNKRASDGIQALSGGLVGKESKVQDPPKDQQESLVNLYSQRQLQQVLERAEVLLQQFPNSGFLYNISGAVYKGLGKLDASVKAFNRAIVIKPDYTEAYYSMGIALQAQAKLEEAIEAYKKVLSLKPDYAEAYNNLGGTLYEQGKLEEAIDAYKKALSIKPHYADAWNNIVFPLQAIKSQISSREDLVSYYPKGTGSHYYETEKLILNFRLDQESERASSSLNETLNFIANTDNSTITNPSGPKTSGVLKPISTGKLIAMTHFGRSGTGLIHSLIDGHPDVSTLPSIYFSQYFRQSSWKDLAANGFDKIVEKFIKKYEVLFDASARRPIATHNKFVAHFGQKDGMTKVGDQRDEVLKVDKILFCSELQRLMDYCEELSAYTFFNLVHLAYNKAINDFNSKSLIFYHIHNPDTYARLNFVRLVPAAHWVMMVRDPIQSCESWILEAFKSNEYSDIANKIHSIMSEIDNVIYHKQSSIGVRLEDLKEHPRQTIPALCEWMGIEETESLYKMTAQGKKWWGDPSSPDFEKDGMEPFGQTSIKRKVGSIFSENDQFILKTLFYPFSVRFGYVQENFEQFKIDLQAIRPILGEMFDFEKTLLERTQANPEQFMKSGSYLYLRSGLIERWNTLNEHHTYPNMIKRLKINYCTQVGDPTSFT